MFSSEFCELFKSTYFGERIYAQLVLKDQCAFLRATFLTKHLQWLVLTVSGFQPATLLNKRLQQRRFSVNFAKFLSTFFDKTPSDGCFLCLPMNFEKFSRSFHLQSTSGKLLISCTSCRILTTKYNKKYFKSAFQVFYRKMRRHYSKAFIIPESYLWLS